MAANQMHDGSHLREIKARREGKHEADMTRRRIATRAQFLSIQTTDSISQHLLPASTSLMLEMTRQKSTSNEEEFYSMRATARPPARARIPALAWPAPLSSTRAGADSETSAGVDSVLSATGVEVTVLRVVTTVVSTTELLDSGTALLETTSEEVEIAVVDEGTEATERVTVAVPEAVVTVVVLAAVSEAVAASGLTRMLKGLEYCQSPSGLASEMILRP